MDLAHWFRTVTPEERAEMRKDLLQFYQGSTREVRGRLGRELAVIVIAWIVLAWLSPMKVDDVDLFAWVAGPMVLLLWALIRLAPVGYGACTFCQGTHNHNDDAPCSECSMRVEMPTHYERYEPSTFKEKVLWEGAQHIPKASRAEWKDGRWER